MALSKDFGFMIRHLFNCPNLEFPEPYPPTICKIFDISGTKQIPAPKIYTLLLLVTVTNTGADPGFLERGSCMF